MSTRSNIGIKNADNTVTFIYVHWDGYPSHNGKILLDNYNTEKKVRDLIALGDISILAPSIEKPEGHTFDNHIKGYCVAYGRDRGEDGTEPRTKSFDSAIEEFDNDYGYLFDDEKWNFCHWNKDWRELTQEDCKEKSTA